MNRSEERRFLLGLISGCDRAFILTAMVSLVIALAAEDGSVLCRIATLVMLTASGAYLGTGILLLSHERRMR